MSAPEHIKTAGDVLSISVVVATLAQWLPYMAAGASLVWSLIRIWETKTVQGWISKWRKK